MAAGAVNVGQLQIVIGANAQPMLAGIQQGINHLQQLRQNVLTMQPAVNQLNNRTRNLQQAFSALIPGIEDFATVMAGGGGFGMAMRSASNNISQATRFLGGMAASFAGIGVVIASIALPRLWDWIVGTEDAQKKTKGWLDEIDRGEVIWEKFGNAQKAAMSAVERGIGGKIQARKFDREVLGMDSEEAKRKLESVRDDLELTQAKVEAFGQVPFESSPFEKKIVEQARSLRDARDKAKAGMDRGQNWAEIEPFKEQFEIAQQKLAILDKIIVETNKGNSESVKTLIKEYERLGEVFDQVENPFANAGAGLEWEAQTKSVGAFTEEVVKSGIKWAEQKGKAQQDLNDLLAEQNRLLEQQTQLQERIKQKDQEMFNAPMWDVNQLFAQLAQDKDAAREEFLKSQASVLDGVEKKFVDEMKRINEIRQKAVDAGLENDPQTQQFLKELEQKNLFDVVQEQLKQDKAKAMSEAPKATKEGGDLIGRDNAAQSIIDNILMATSLVGEQNTAAADDAQLKKDTLDVLKKLDVKLADQTKFIPIKF